MSNVFKLNDYRKFDALEYSNRLKTMNIPDLLYEMSVFSDEWREKNGQISSEFKRKGLLLFTEVYHMCQTPELRQAALTALAELEKA